MKTYWVDIDVHVSEDPHVTPERSDRRQTIAVRVEADSFAHVAAIAKLALQSLFDQAVQHDRCKREQTRTVVGIPGAVDIDAVSAYPDKLAANASYGKKPKAASR